MLCLDHLRARAMLLLYSCLPSAAEHLLPRHYTLKVATLDDRISASLYCSTRESPARIPEYPNQMRQLQFGACVASMGREAQRSDCNRQNFGSLKAKASVTKRQTPASRIPMAYH
jgi:hypothetical protein